LTTALADIPALAVTEGEAARLGFGQALSLIEFMGRVPSDAEPEGGLVRVMAGERFVGLCRLEEGQLRPERLMAPA
jgi:tRNA pseudouridine55 synthase